MADDKGAKKKEEKKDAEGEGAAPAPVAAGSKKKLFMIIGGVVVVLIIAVVLVLVLKGGQKKVKEVENVVEEVNQHEILNQAQDELDETEEAIGAIYPFDTFLLNLKSGGYLRVQIQLEFVERDITPRFFTRQVMIRDGLITLLTSKTAEDVNTPEGKEKLKSEIKDLVNEVLKKQDVKRAYFTQFVIQ